MRNTKIEWCDDSWNPITGCKHNCEYCYARRIAARFGGFDGYGCEEDHERVETLGKYELQKPAYIKRGTERKMVKAPFPFGFEPTLHRYRLDEPQHWKNPRNVFVGSMADIFGEWTPDSWIEEVFAACEKAPRHRYIFLTKNPARYARLDKPQGKNFWFGASATNHQSAEFAFRHLPPSWGYNFFLSAEPLLDGINLNALSDWPRWVIVGAMTGPGASQNQPRKEWVGDIVRWAEQRKIPVFMKDSLIPVIGEERMIQEFPWEQPGTSANEAAYRRWSDK